MAVNPTTAYPWLLAYLPHITQSWGQNGETGVDLGTPYGTPITSLTWGTIEAFGYYAGGGVVTVKSKIDGKFYSVYYQHLDLINNGLKVGMPVKPGDLLGWSGGQLSGGHHPSTRAHSTGPHTEVGRDAPYGGIWGKQFNPNADPVPWLKRLAAGDTAAQGEISTGSFLNYAQNVATTMVAPLNPMGGNTQDDSWALLCANLDAVEMLANPFSGNLDFNPLDGSPAFGQIGSVLWQDIAAICVRGLIILIGFLLAAKVLLSVIPVQQIEEQAVQAGGAIAALA